MRIFGFGRKKTGGLIGYFGLEEWWHSVFTEAERRYICDTFQPLGSSGDTLTSGNIRHTSQSAAAFLSNLAGWFQRPEDRPIAHKILAKAEEYANDAPVLDRHFQCQARLELYYKDRDQPGLLEKAIAACREQIALAPEAARAFTAAYAGAPLPSHRGYYQLSVILEKQGKYDEATALCKQAAEQGWAGDWDRRIERYQKKQEKSDGRN